SRTRNAAVGSGSVEIAGRIANQTCLGITPIRSASEVVQHGFVTACVQLENRPAIRSAAVEGGAIQIACVVPQQPGMGILSIRTASKAVQHGFVAVFVQLEHRPPTRNATNVGGSVEIAHRVTNQTGVGSTSIGSAGEAKQHT